MRRILVTGVNGFVGKHLVKELVSQNTEVVGLDYKQPPHPEIAALLKNYLVADLTDEETVTALDLSDIDCVINLAGLAQVGNSFQEAALYKKVNVAVLTNIGKVLLEQNKFARLIAISSGAIYDPNQNMPLTEESKILATGSPYAMSKIMMEREASKLTKQGLDCVVVRPFNHIGPGQNTGFLVPDLLDKIRNVSPQNKKIRVGNLQTKRDYTDVRDVVKAYAYLASAKNLSYNLYNVCSEKSISGEEILEALLEATRLKEAKFIIDPSLIRPNDPDELFGSNERLAKDTGWRPKISISQTITDIVASA